MCKGIGGHKSPGLGKILLDRLVNRSGRDQNLHHPNLPSLFLPEWLKFTSQLGQTMLATSSLTATLQMS